MEHIPETFRYIDRLIGACRSHNIEPPIGIVVSNRDFDELKAWANVRQYVQVSFDSGNLVRIRGIEVRRAICIYPGKD